MQRDSRYDLIRPMFEKGKIQNILDIFKYIPKSVVGGDILSKRRLYRLMDEPLDFTLAELAQLADAFGLTIDEILELAKKDMKSLIKS